MRTWFSAPLGHGFRAGVSVNPAGYVTRRLAGRELISPAGRAVSVAGLAVIVVVALIWAKSTNLQETWLEILIATMAASWVLNRVVLAMFPRDFGAEFAEAAKEAPSPESTVE